MCRHLLDPFPSLWYCAPRAQQTLEANEFSEFDSLMCYSPRASFSISPVDHQVAELLPNCNSEFMCSLAVVLCIFQNMPPPAHRPPHSKPEGWTEGLWGLMLVMVVVVRSSCSVLFDNSSWKHSAASSHLSCVPLARPTFWNGALR